MAIKAFSLNRDEADEGIFRVNVDDPQPGDIRYIDKLIRMKAASDSILEILIKFKNALAEHIKREAVVDITKEGVTTTTEAQKALNEGVPAIAEGLEALDKIAEDQANPQNSQDTKIVNDALAEITSETKKAGEYAQKAVETCQKYANKETLIEFSLEDIKKDLDEMKENTHKVETSHIRIQRAHGQIKEVRQRRGIHSDIQHKETNLETGRINKDYSASALNFLKENGVNPSNIQTLSATANNLNQKAQNQLEDSQSTLEQLQTQLERAQAEAMATAKSAKHSINQLFTAPATSVENSGRLTP
ncbi:MAG: hypothetical protein K1X66_04840 [Verrucomicrobiae bacterium]|nr:hypothetical protein [Verrucomicrobiae bacterium]